MAENCLTCRYSKLSHLEEPCKYCGNHSEFKPRIEDIDEMHEWKMDGSWLQKKYVTQPAPESKPEPKKVYLTTHNPYTSKDWKKRFEEIMEARTKIDPWSITVDTDVASMYPSFDKYCDYAMKKSWEDYCYMIPPRAGKSAALGAIKLGERELEYCKQDVESTMALYEAFKTKEDDTYDWMAHSVNDIFKDMGTILYRRQEAEKDFKSKEWVWEISEDIWQRLKEKPEFIGHCYSTSLPATIYCIDVRVTKLKTNYIKLVRKVKEEKDMGLTHELNKTNGEAMLMINGHKYPVQITTVDVRRDEPATYTMYVKDAPYYFYSGSRHAGYSAHYTFIDEMAAFRGVDLNRSLPSIKKVMFEDPATIVFWKDGTKTVVRAQDEKFDPEKGLAMAISRKALGNQRDYYNVFLKWLKKFKKQEEKYEASLAKSFESLKNYMDKMQDEKVGD